MSLSPSVSVLSRNTVQQMVVACAGHPLSLEIVAKNIHALAQAQTHTAMEKENEISVSAL